MKKFVAVAGNIGAGKSTLVEKLCAKMGWEPYFEPVAENPYLKNFYLDMKVWAFQSQVYFLTHRMRSHFELLMSTSSVLQDRTVYEDAEIFARNLYLQGNMTETDYATYRELFELFITMLNPPDLVLYLSAPVETLLARISTRGRDFESTISAEYLTQLNDLYKDWIGGFHLCPVLTIPADQLDFVHTPGHLDLIAKKVEDKLRGKEEVYFAPEDILRYR
ncbi:MAG TPA: deoxynucleoside kinase [Anaerolineales bacterium]|nr:deoxynucleoside kinase [Anaerolineales bacterium]